MIQILRINISQSIDCSLTIIDKKQLEQFRKKLIEQAKIGISDDKVKVDFVIQEPPKQTV